MNKAYLFILSLLLIVVNSAFSQNVDLQEKQEVKAKIKINGPKASWDKTIIDFGEIPYKTQKKDEFTVTNKGNQPLFIVYGQSSCGCAKLDYNEAPILPEKSSKVTITYDGTDLGDFLKTISIVTNESDERTVLQVKGSVVKK
jgi:hypothetical protein